MNDEYNINDTIVALATPFFKSALAVIRMSGKNAFNIASSICYNAKTEKKIKSFEHRKSYYVIVKDENGALVDELVILTTLSPNTFTAEDTIEFISHGSPVVIETLIGLIIRNGARLAKNGEFTYRAYINGRISISEAEAIHDLIESDNRFMAEASIYKMRGRLTHEIDSLKDKLKYTIMLVEGEIDFPEDETVIFSYGELIENLKLIKKDIENILFNSHKVQKLMHGIKVAILGRVNAGKSSVFNMILDKDRAIVSSLEGTTRDFLTESIYIDNIPFYIMDTAGFHDEASDEVEIEGIERAKKCALESDIILAVFDSGEKTSKDDIALIDFLSNIKDKEIIYVLNKNDRAFKFEGVLDDSRVKVSLSAKTNEGKLLLINAMKSLIKKEDIDIFNKDVYVNIRERGCLEAALKQIDLCIEKSNDKYTLDHIAEEIRSLNDILGKVSGRLEADDIINEIFSKFCIGK